MNSNFGLGFYTTFQFFWWSVTASPVRTYNRIKAWRDKLLATVEYLQTESAKWRTAFNIIKSPYSFLRACGLNPQMAATFLFAGSVATTGVVAAEMMEPPSFSRGDAGVYNAPLDAPIFFEEKFNTLRLDLGTTSVGLIEITDTTLGTAYTGSTLPSGETNVIIVGGLPTVTDPAFTETFLEVGHLIVDRWRCETLTLSNIEAHALIVHGNVSDGMSIAAVAGTPRDRGINGGNRASDMIVAESYYDQMKITAAASGVNGKVDVLRLSNLYSKGGGCKLDRIKAGTLEITLNEIGGDSDLATKSFILEDTVEYKSMLSTANYEVEMAVPAAQ